MYKQLQHRTNESEAVHIGEAARQLGVTIERLRQLERSGQIPPPARDFIGRIYYPSDIALMKAMGVGNRSRKKLLSLEELTERVSER